MINYLRLFFLMGLCLPMFAYSSVFTFEYSGRLTDRYTAGYEFPEYISGTLTFDLAFARDVYPGDPYYSEYQILSGSPDFVTGYVTPYTGRNTDFVRVNNGFGEPGNPEPFWDGFNINDGSVINNIEDSIFVGVEVEGLDWLFNDSVKEFSYTGEDMNNRSNARVSRYSYLGIAPDGAWMVRPIYDAYYLLDFAKLTAKDVPEPGSLLLLFVGGLGLLLRRQYKTR